MAQEAAQTSKVQASAEASRAVAGAKVRRADLGRAVRLGLLGGVVAVFISTIGMIEAFADRGVVQPYLSLSYTALLLIPFTFGSLAGRKQPEIEGLPSAQTGPRNLIAGLIAGVLAGGVTSLFVAIAQTVNLRSVFLAISPRLLLILTFGRDLGQAIAILVLAAAALGLLGAGVALLPRLVRRPLLNGLVWTLLIGLLESVLQQVLSGLHLNAVNAFLFSPAGGLKPIQAVLVVFPLMILISLGLELRGPMVGNRVAALSKRERQRFTLLGLGVLVVVLAILPQVIGVFLSEVLDLVGIFLLMGLGLNIVVGFAGLLDLGYVAFFAVGAYTTAVLTSPGSPAFSPQLTFWAALPFVMLAAAFAGILVGTPVLRMRGDYLAIVTLGFGEIARLLFISEWLVPYVGGAQGIISIPKLSIGSFVARTPPQLFYPIIAFVFLAIYISWALKNSRIGRAWMAMREDEPVAEVMGIDIVTAKLQAFIMGAVLASFGGALFATKIGSIFPNSFQIQVSITVLVLIIVGGIGSIPGVTVGALILVGLPELLREFNEYRLLMYGVLLIYMMLNRPEGFIPTQERMRELHQEEMLQDAWVQKEQEPAGAAGPAPEPAPGGGTD